MLVCSSVSESEMFFSFDCVAVEWKEEEHLETRTRESYLNVNSFQRRWWVEPSAYIKQLEQWGIQHWGQGGKKAGSRGPAL